MLQSTTDVKAEDSKPAVSKVMLITAVAKKHEDPTVKKGELMESNIDAMEVVPYSLLTSLEHCCSVESILES